MEKTLNPGSDKSQNPIDSFLTEGKSIINSGFNHMESGLEKAKSASTNALNEGQSKISSMEKTLYEKGCAVTKQGKEYIHKNPVRAVVAASATGVFVGLLLSMFRN